ncbi:flagellin [Deferribacterales bacterium RsTz2092]|nr:hypothetical protein AGMMS49941_08830 [Deferribacterales bacterium]
MSTFAMEAIYDVNLKKMVFNGTANNEAYVHIVRNATTLQIGPNQGHIIDISIPQLDLASIGIEDVYLITPEDAAKSITKCDMALEMVNHARATLGAQINRLEFSMQNLTTGRQNLVSAESRIRDLDIAEESALFASKQILVNAAVAMLAQANTLPQTALQLIQGR